jgi:hypothetical protein
MTVTAVTVPRRSAAVAAPPPMIIRIMSSATHREMKSPPWAVHTPGAAVQRIHPITMTMTMTIMIMQRRLLPIRWLRLHKATAATAGR